MELADRFRIPLLTLVDTAGAYPGVDAEERGQAEAIARSTSACLALKVPSISVVIGEGGSGGAIAIATANRVYMLEHAIYSVISPEGAASILWRDTTRSKDAATNMKITAQDLLELQDHRRHHSRTARRRPSRPGSGDCRHRRPDRQDAEGIRRRPTPISASSAARNTWRWAATSRRICRPMVSAAKWPHFATKMPLAGQCQSTIAGRDGAATLAVMNFQG